MPDSATDLAKLTAQLGALRGDLNRRFEQSSARFDELSGRIEQVDRFVTTDTRIDDLSAQINTVGVTRKVPLLFSAALDGQWVRGTTSPQATLRVDKSGPRFVAAGRMLVSLPHLSRIAVFRASVSFLGLDLGGLDLSFVCVSNISLLRDTLKAVPGQFIRQEEIVVQLSHFQSNIPDQEGVPIVGTEFVDNDRFTYKVLAELFVPNPTESELLIPEAMFVVKTFQVDCIVA
jgi:hypothetical protein